MSMFRPARLWPHEASNFTTVHVSAAFGISKKEAFSFIESEGVQNGVAALRAWKAKFNTSQAPSLALIVQENRPLAGSLSQGKYKVKSPRLSF
jgi:hypothetical protein